MIFHFPHFFSKKSKKWKLTRVKKWGVGVCEKTKNIRLIRFLKKRGNPSCCITLHRPAKRGDPSPTFSTRDKGDRTSQGDITSWIQSDGRQYQSSLDNVITLIGTIRSWERRCHFACQGSVLCAAELHTYSLLRIPKFSHPCKVNLISCEIGCNW